MRLDLWSVGQRLEKRLDRYLRSLEGLLARYAREKGMKVALATNGTLVTPELARKIVDAGIVRVAMSVDGASVPRRAAISATVLPAYEGLGVNVPIRKSSGDATSLRMNSVSARSVKLRLG